MTLRLTVGLIATVVSLATLVPAAPAAAICNAEDPTVEKVVCGIVYPSLQKVFCRLGSCPT